MISGVIFDLDGTLVDSWAVHRKCLRHVAVATGMAKPSAARTAAAQRATDLGTLRALVGDDRLDEAHLIYRRALRDSLAAEAVPAMPGAAEAIGDLRGLGLTVGVCTGRSRDDAQALLDASGLDIELIVAREDAPRPKPAPDGLLRAVWLLGLTAQTAMHVGDTRADLKQGRSAGVRTVLVGPVGVPLTDLVPVLRTDRP